MHPTQADVDLLLKDCQFHSTRRQGPGGQHRNKVETAVIVTHKPTGISAEANEKRSQDANKKVAIFRLRVLLAIEVRTEQDEDPSPLFRQRTANGRFSVNPTHTDFPSVLSELLDRLSHHEFSIPDSAESIGVSGSQILKFLKSCPAAFEYFNKQRTKRNLHRIKF